VRTVTYEDIAWLVLDERDGKLLLLAKDITEKRPYNADRFCGAWEGSSLCGYLCDGQFILSIEEASKYFSNDTDRAACYQGEPWAWWLRDIGIKNHATFVGKDGGISVHGYRVDCFWYGVRPAMWIESDKVI
jgi:hypothetical protein